MKKTVLLLIFILVFSFIVSCTPAPQVTPTPPKENETEEAEFLNDISEIFFKRVSFMGGNTEIIKIDFSANKVYRSRYTPDDRFSEEDQENEGYIEIRTFTEEDEKEFITICKMGGIFEIEKKYERTDVADGGSWEMIVNYKNGDVKRSIGINEDPEEVFAACSVAFYNLCGEDVVGYLPADHHKMPFPFLHLIYEKKPDIYPYYRISAVRADYSFNEGAIICKNDDYFKINEIEKNTLIESNDEIEYSLRITFKNNTPYKVEKTILRSYDYNEELTGEKLLYEWETLKDETIPIELEKIYVLDIRYENGDFSRYTFNTKSIEIPNIYPTFTTAD